MSDTMQLHIIITGRVQGVCFRFNTKKTAEDLGIDGWVKNLPDGNVEAVFEGEEKKLLKILDFIKKGPFGSRVIKTTENWSDKKNEFENFRVKY
jgi:acylphosphatase